jgi:PTS system nitrogen regulatory IIA component
MKVVDFLAPDAVIPALRGSSKSEVLAELAAFLTSRPGPPVPAPAEKVFRILAEREQIASTAIGDGLAIPHAKLDDLEYVLGVLGRAPSGVDFDALDGKPTYLVFMLVTPVHSAGQHLQALARLSRMFRDAGFRQRLLAAPDGASMYRTIQEEDAKL